MIGKFLIIDIINNDYMKDKNGDIIFYDTQDEASSVCGMYEFPDVLVVEIKYNHIERNLSYADLEKNGELE